MKFDDQIALIVRRLSHREYRPDLLVYRYFVRLQDTMVAYRMFKTDEIVHYCQLSDIVLVNGKERNT